MPTFERFFAMSESVLVVVCTLAPLTYIAHTHTHTTTDIRTHMDFLTRMIFEINYYISKNVDSTNIQNHPIYRHLLYRDIPVKKNGFFPTSPLQNFETPYNIFQIDIFF